jgi:hypothetical protein
VRVVKNKILILTLSFLVLLAAATGAVAAGVEDTKHDLNYTINTVYFSGATCDTCAYCHTPHGSLSYSEYIGPLWNQENTEGLVQNDGEVYTSATMDMVQQTDISTFYGIAGVSNACLSCHDGVQAMDTVARGMSAGSASGQGVEADESFVNLSGADIGAGPGGSWDTTGIVDLSDDHPVAIEYSTAKDPKFNSNPRDDFGRSLLHSPDKTVECTSCHNPHEADVDNDGLNSGDDRPFLRMGNGSSALCFECHRK